MSNSETKSEDRDQHGNDIDTDADIDADAILAELEAEADDDVILRREERLNSQAHQMSSSSHIADGSSKATVAGGITSTSTAKTENIYTTLKSDDATLQFTTEYEKSVVHFFHPDFARCAIMDSHLEQISRKHAEFGRGSEESEVHFGRVDVSHAPFVVERMGIRVLPCVIGFVKGAVKGRIVGFEGLCWDGKEKSLRVCQAVEETLVDWTLFKKPFVGKGYGDEDEESDQSDGKRSQRENGKGARRGIQGRKQIIEDEDDDWD